MKTIVSIPDDIFEQAENVARKLKISRNEFYARAVAAFLEQQHADDVTLKLNEIYNQQESNLDSQLLKLQTQLLSNETW